jgi:hypothetical protein
MVDFSTMLTNMCVVKPLYTQMQRAYDDYRLDSAPCKAGVTNQCAVRMSVALERCGFSLDAFQPQNRVHRNRRSCQLTVPHVLGAEELASYLRQMWGGPEQFRGGTLQNAQTSLQFRRGIIYFNNCFRRGSGGPMVGDHIDLWTGTQYYNQIIHVGAGGDARAGTSLFDRADAVSFFLLPG